MTDLEREDERNPLVILVVNLLVILHRGTHAVVDEVLVQSSLEVFGESKGGADPAVFVEDAVLHYRLVSSIHALDSRALTSINVQCRESPAHPSQPTCAVNVAVAGDQETGDGEDTEGVLVVKAETEGRR